MILSLQTIGQAYEDMQTQNQHLLQQVADRDDFNIKVFRYPSILLLAFVEFLVVCSTLHG